MSGYSETSRAAFASVDLQAAEAEVLAAIRKHFADGRKFTRAELADKMQWSINRVTGRALTLIERGLLTESEATVKCPVTGGNAHHVWLASVAANDTSSEEFRHACEVRRIAAMESDNQRRLFLQGVLAKRGEAAYKKLRADVWAAMQRVSA